MAHKTVYLMRGLPSCGKSHTARQIAGDSGVVCETDAYFYIEVGTDPTQYDYDRSLLDTARRWNLARFVKAVDEGITPVVVDRGNGRSLYTQAYARYAVDNGYDVTLAEPESPWWADIRVLLKYRPVTSTILDDWAVRLAKMSRSTHRTPLAEIRRRIDRWADDLTVEHILDYVPGGNNGKRMDIGSDGSTENVDDTSAVITMPRRALMLGAQEDMSVAATSRAVNRQVEHRKKDTDAVMVFDADGGEFM